jgi:hypothetical protein
MKYELYVLVLGDNPSYHLGLCHCRCFRLATYQGEPEVDECGLAKIGNSKEETHGTQFRQVRAARCLIPYVLYGA